MADSTYTRLTAWLDKKHSCKTVRERILRLNPSIEVGQQLRGWHPKDTYRSCLDRDIVGKGEFIRRWGRLPWSIIHKKLKYKKGRREYVSRETFQDMPMSMRSGLGL